MAGKGFGFLNEASYFSKSCKLKIKECGREGEQGQSEKGNFELCFLNLSVADGYFQFLSLKKVSTHIFRQVRPVLALRHSRRQP